MDRRVTTLRPGSDDATTPPPHRPSSRWTGLLLLVAGIAGGYLLAQGTASDSPAVDAAPAEAAPSAAAVAAQELFATEPPVEDPVSFSGTILASVEFGRGIVTWPGDGDPSKIRLGSDVWDAAYDATQSRIAVTLPEYGSNELALHLGTLGDLRFVTSGVTGFVWHPIDPSAIAWVEESLDGFALMTAVVSDRGVEAALVAVLPDRVRPVAWGSWGYAVDGDDGLTTLSPSGEVIANGDLQFVAAGSDGRMIVARPAGLPLSSDWALTDPDLSRQESLGRFDEPSEHPTAAAILPSSGRIVLVSNRFGDGAEVAAVEILSADGTRETLLRSGMIAESVAWSPDEERLAVGGYYYGPGEVRSVVLLADADGTGSPIEVPFDHQVRPLGIGD